MHSSSKTLAINLLESYKDEGSKNDNFQHAETFASIFPWALLSACTHERFNVGGLVTV